MYDHACRLIDDQQMIIFIDDIQCDIFRLECIGLWRLLRNYLHLFSTPYLELGGRRLVIDGHQTFLDPGLQART